MINKVKTWLSSKQQFKVVAYYDNPPGYVKTVQRIKDDAVFVRFAPIKLIDEDVTMYITSFYADMIGVDFEIMSLDSETKIGTCEINDLDFSDDGYRIVDINNCVFQIKINEPEQDSKG